MLYLRYVAFFLIFLVLGFLAMGLFNSRFSSEMQVEVRQPVSEVKKVLLDTSYAPKWMYNYLQTDFVQGSRSKVGDISMISFQDEQGNIMTVKERITGMSDERIQSTWEHDRFDMQFEYVFTPGDSGTRVQLNFSGKGKGLLYRSMFAFIKGSLIAGQEANLQQLAEVLNEE